jgi:hypothetical protein
VDRILQPENVLYVMERAARRLRERLEGQGDETAGLWERLAEIEREFENLVRLAAKVGDLDAHAKVLGELLAERAALEARLRSSARRRRVELDEAWLRDLVEESVADLRSAYGRRAGRPMIGANGGGQTVA